MQQYFTQICDATINGVNNTSDKVGARAFEYWTTLVEDETERLMKGLLCVNYIKGCADSLIDLILKGLAIITFDEDDDNEDWGHSLSAAFCL